MMRRNIKLFLAGFLVGISVFIAQSIIAQSNGTAHLRLWRSDGSVEEYDCVQIVLEPTPTFEFVVTDTPIPTETNTPEPTDTPRPTITPGPSLTPLPLCQGTTTAPLNFRSGPGSSYAILQDFTKTPPVNIVFPKDALIPINDWSQASGTIWYKTIYKAQAGWVSGAYVTLVDKAACQVVFPTLPRTLNLKTAVGVRTVPGAAGFEEMYSILKARGIPYGVSPYGSLAYCLSALQQGGHCIYRPGAPDCPPDMYVSEPRQNARTFMGNAMTALEMFKGYPQAYVEPINECMGTPSYSELVWWREWMDEYVTVVHNRGLTKVALPGLPPGNGNQEMFTVWKPVMIKMLAWGDIFSMHDYTFRSQTGLCVYDQWEAARHTLLHKYMIAEGYEIPIAITEAARWSGNAPVDEADFVCFIKKISEEGYVYAVEMWVGGLHGTWPLANLDGHYTSIAYKL